MMRVMQVKSSGGNPLLSESTRLGKTGKTSMLMLEDDGISGNQAGMLIQCLIFT